VTDTGTLNLPTDHHDQWGDLECLYKACQAARTDGGLFTDTGVDERGENERHSEHECEMETLGQWANRLCSCIILIFRSTSHRPDDTIDYAPGSVFL